MHTAPGPTGSAGRPFSSATHKHTQSRNAIWREVMKFVGDSFRGTGADSEPVRKQSMQMSVGVQMVEHLEGQRASSEVAKKGICWSATFELLRQWVFLR